MATSVARWSPEESAMDVEDRPPPAKKRRFFVDEPPTPKAKPDLAAAGSGLQDDLTKTVANRQEQSGHEDQRDLPATSETPVTFDGELLESFLGEKIDSEVVQRLRELSGDNIERAINLYLDGSYKQTAPQQSTPPVGNAHRQSQPSDFVLHSSNGLSRSTGSSSSHEASHGRPNIQKHMPERRYIGAFGAVGWTTRSGIGLITHGEKVTIERAKPQNLGTRVTKGLKSRGASRQDNIVRFTNTRKEEVGRLETDTATWVAPLIDNKLCQLDAYCVYAPDRVRSGETIYLQIHCFFRKVAFESKSFLKPMDNNRTTSIYEAKETDEERNLHLRQAALVKLFSEINLQPTKSNATTEKHKREGLLKATEVSEQYDQQKEKKDTKDAENEGSSPPSEENEDGEELAQDQLDTLYAKAQTFDFNTPEYEPASTFSMDLRKYQKQALHWMVNKEKDDKAERKEQSMHPLWEEYAWPAKDVDGNELPSVEDGSSFYVNPYSGELSLDFPVQDQQCLGGILADEMGLGKTIEMLSLMHSHRTSMDHGTSSEATESTVNSLPRLPKTTASLEPAPCTTLVVAPMSLLSQWESEAEKASKTSTLRTLVYYGADRGLNLRHLCCASNAAKAPNLIITSYGTVLSEYGQVASSGGDRSAHVGLFSLDYFRIILDEAHHIKNRQSKTAKACYELAAKHRWVLTGTPIVNRLEDLFSLVHFLRVEPWSNFSFWKTFITVPFESKDYVKALDVVQTVLEPLVMRRTKDMKTPEGEALVPLPPRTIEIENIVLSKDERDVYYHIYTRAKRTFAANVEAGTLMKSYTTIFAQILRLRQSCCHPILTRNKAIVADEEDAAAASDVANGLADDMDLAALIQRFTAEEGEQDASRYGRHALEQIRSEVDAECPICSEEPMVEQAVTGCWHSACKGCLLDYIEHQTAKNELPRCFNCREPINSRDVFEVVRDDNDDLYTAQTPPPASNSDDEAADAIDGKRISLRRLTPSGSTGGQSAKITALLRHLTSKRRSSPTSKSVVFSQFTSFLDLIEPFLRSAKFSFLRLDGAVSQKSRASILTQFSSPVESSSAHKTPTVLLLSLRAGGVGLNLTAASNVYMMDPWWSWAVEAQAIDRVHRMGQEKDVKVVRFVCEESIEEKMLRVQERKKFIASSLGMMSEEERRKERVEDIRTLLS
ncbi:MAG: DNA helicase rad5 [Chrysothrix sp. TS-e1954]|nr:MAG: DNA helicase rad5 [Chrysothrix sp. TS-e1954]